MPSEIPTHLYRPLKLGRYTMKNRFVAAPLTRCRAGPDHTPNSLMCEYYAARASFGLIITEATMIQRGYSTFGYEPGIFNREQVEGWRRVTDAVHERGGLIYCQLHHGGRATVPCNVTSQNAMVMGPSRRGIGGAVECPISFALDGRAQQYPSSVHSMSVVEILDTIGRFARAAKNAMAAGFDGVEIDAGGGYLIDQFLRTESNDRSDNYGGTLRNRCRLLFQVVDAVIAAIGANRVGVRISPLSTANGIFDAKPESLTKYIGTHLNSRKIVFLDVVRGDPPTDNWADDDCGSRDAELWARSVFSGILFSGLGFNIAEGESAIASRRTDAVCFGRLSVSNPDLIWRLLNRTPIVAPHLGTLFTRGREGYVDYDVFEPERPRIPSEYWRDRSRTYSVTESVANSHHHFVLPLNPGRQCSNGNGVSPKSVSRYSSRRPDDSVVSGDKPISATLNALAAGTLMLKNRAVMGPLPRQRASRSHMPTAAMMRYYSDRAGFGLIISEPCEIVDGYNTFVQGPGIYRKNQVNAWRRITDAVHAKGGMMVCQLHHGGRAVLPCNLEGPARVVAPSALGIPRDCVGGICDQDFAADGRAQRYPEHVVAITRREMMDIITAYATCTKQAIFKGGFDGVEIQAGNGYLIDQFLRRSSNNRSDEYGGSIANRCRFLLQVVDAATAQIGRGRVGVRISPTDPSRGMFDPEPEALTKYLGAELNQRRVAYVAVSTRDCCAFSAVLADASAPIAWLRETYHGVVVADDDIDVDVAEARIGAKAIDAASFTRLAVSNPDFVDQALRGLGMQWPDEFTFFTHDPVEGYNSYVNTDVYPRSLRSLSVVSGRSESRVPRRDDSQVSQHIIVHSRNRSPVSERSRKASWFAEEPYGIRVAQDNSNSY